MVLEKTHKINKWHTCIPHRAIGWVDWIHCYRTAVDGIHISITIAAYRYSTVVSCVGHTTERNKQISC